MRKKILQLLLSQNMDLIQEAFVLNQSVKSPYYSWQEIFNILRISIFADVEDKDDPYIFVFDDYLDYREELRLLLEESEGLLFQHFSALSLTDWWPPPNGRPAQP